ncbi:hypothetical protein AB205_0008440 [Aquarana catesbeiana]|uniref:Uncharacterized protein n=1 Tax=Aquarana catesbeiana TaxID=8400 RepID=A0A2G9RC26_AQUCT|nr:hypothetical protein AB205_0008440 [Aquarana catesbeiana]
MLGASKVVLNICQVIDCTQNFMQECFEYLYEHLFGNLLVWPILVRTRRNLSAAKSPDKLSQCEPALTVKKVKTNGCTNL